MTISTALPKLTRYLLEEITRCKDADATISSVTMIYVCIDTMAFLSMPVGQTTQGKRDFIVWVDTYLKTAQSNTYQYRGLDLYAARCSLLHAFSAEARIHKEDVSIPVFSYLDNGPHAFDPSVSPRVVLISVEMLIQDLARAIMGFFAVMETDADLRALVESRLPSLYEELPFGVDAP
jgi:hypothetical protein